MSPASILIIKPSSLGDVVHTLPAVALLKRHFPQSTIRWVVNPEWAPLLAGNPGLEEVVIFPRGTFRGWKGLAKIGPWARSMQAYRSELVLDFQGLLRSAMIGRLCRGGSLLGLSDAREGARFFYDGVADVSAQSHAVDRYLQLVATLGVDTTGPLEWPMPLGVPVAGVAPGYVLLHPFSRGEGKSLSLSQVREFCAALAPLRVILVGRSAEAVPAQANALNLLNRTSLEELVWLIRTAGYVVSVDSGPMHMAAALTPRLLALHTWSDPAKVGPYRPEAWIWKSQRLFQRAHPEAGRPVSDFGEIAIFVRDQMNSFGGS